MVHLKIVFDKRRQKADGSYPITFRITKSKKVNYIQSGISVPEELWDEDNRQVKKNHPNAPYINETLSKTYYNIQKQIIKLSEENSFSFDELQQALNPSPTLKAATITFEKFSNQIIDEFKLVKRFGNAIVYQTAVNRLLSYTGSTDLCFDKIDFTLLDAFSNKLLKEGVKTNTVGNYLRSIRAIFNKAIKAKVVSRELYPFYDLGIKTEKTRKRNISKVNIQQLNLHAIQQGTNEWDARNYFLISFYLIGISFTDLAYLMPDNIQDGRLIYKRRKTHKWYNIKLFTQVTDLLFDYYTPGNTYLLPILPNGIEEDTVDCKRIIGQWIKTTNKYLKRIGKDLKLELPLTTYVTRHSWATIAKKMGYSNELIAEALGHSYGNRVTNTYLDDFDKEIIDEMHYKIIS